MPCSVIKLLGSRRGWLPNLEIKDSCYYLQPLRGWFSDPTGRSKFEPHPWQHPRLATHVGRNLADSFRSHACVKSFRVRIGGELKYIRPTLHGAGFGMLKQSSTYAAAHLFRPDPHVLDFRQRIRHDERATSDNLAIDGRREDFVTRDEFMSNRQVRLPLLDPAFGIVPVTFRRMRDFSEGVCFLRIGAANLDAHGARSLSRGGAVARL